MSTNTTRERPEPMSFPFKQSGGLDLPGAYTELLHRREPTRVQLPFGEPAWLVTRYEDARLVLADPRFSRNLAVHRDEPRMTPRPIPESILTMDPPDHTRIRKLVAKAFTPRRVEALRPWIAELASKLLADMKATGSSAELVESFALPFPITVICELFGVPELNRPQLRTWCDAALSTNEATDEECMQSFTEMTTFFTELVADRRITPRDDLASALVEARDEQERLSEQELIMLCIAIVMGGFETTASAIPNFVYLLQQRHDLWDQLRDDLSLVPAAVEEMLRFTPFFSNGVSPRYPLEDVEIGGVLVRAEEPVIVDTSAVDRDPLVFENPDEVKLDREDNRHMGFGHGAHRCLGMHLARVELQEALIALLTEIPDLRIAGTVGWKLESTVHAPHTLPVEWDASRGPQSASSAQVAAPAVSRSDLMR